MGPQQLPFIDSVAVASRNLSPVSCAYTQSLKLARNQAGYETLHGSYVPAEDQ